MKLNLQSRMLPYIWGSFSWVSPRQTLGPNPDAGGVLEAGPFQALTEEEERESS